MSRLRAVFRLDIIFTTSTYGNYWFFIVCPSRFFFVCVIRLPSSSYRSGGDFEKRARNDTPVKMRRGGTWRGRVQPVPIRADTWREWISDEQLKIIFYRVKRLFTKSIENTSPYEKLENRDKPRGDNGILYFFLILAEFLTDRHACMILSRLFVTIVDDGIAKLKSFDLRGRVRTSRDDRPPFDDSIVRHRE